MTEISNYRKNLKIRQQAELEASKVKLEEWKANLIEAQETYPVWWVKKNTARIEENINYLTNELA